MTKKPSKKKKSDQKTPEEVLCNFQLIRKGDKLILQIVNDLIEVTSEVDKK